MVKEIEFLVKFLYYTLISIIEDYINFVETKKNTLLRIISRTELSLARSLNEKINQQMNLDLSISQIQCLQFLCLSMGTSQKDLAENIGVSKQAMNQIVNTLEEKNLVRRISDETDSRKKIIRHSSKGLELISLILSVTKETEDKFIKLLGKKNMRDLKTSLEKINQQL